MIYASQRRQQWRWAGRWRVRRWEILQCLMALLARHFGGTGQLPEVGGLLGGQSCMHVLGSSHRRSCRSSQGRRAAATVVATVIQW
jgi:hypothetical protein